MLVGCGGQSTSRDYSVKEQVSESYEKLYEDAEDGSVERWSVYDNTPAGATVSNVVSNGSQVIQFTGSGKQNAYRIGNIENRAGAWNNTTEHTLVWSMNFNESFQLFVRVMTNDGARYIYYTNDEFSLGKRDGTYIHIGLGARSSSGTWQTFTKNISVDLQKYEPTNQLVAINGVMLRGSGMIDNLELKESLPVVVGEDNVTIYEDGEDGTIGRWNFYDNTPAGATISNVIDNGNQVIQLSGSGKQNAYRIGNVENATGAWNNTEEHTLEWSMNFNESFQVFVRVMTNDGARYIYYTDDEVSLGKRNGTYIHIGLGAVASSGSWQNFTRNISVDLQKYEPTNQLVAINGVIIRGSGMVDNIKLKKSLPVVADEDGLTVYEDAEDGTSGRWNVYDNTPAGATVSNVSDNGNKVIQFVGSGKQNAYRIGNIENRVGAWNNTAEHTLEWSMNFNESFQLFVRIMTNDGPRYIYYTDHATSLGKRDGTYIHIGLGATVSNGTWQNFSRDVSVDLKKYEPTNQLVAINGFMVRGSGMIDNVQLKESTPLTSEQIAQLKIQSYASNGSNPLPTLQDYSDAGVAGVTSTNLDGVNSLVEQSREEDVDTVAELNAIVNTVNNSLPSLANAVAQVYTKDTGITVLTFVNTGGDVNTCMVSPALPAGLIVAKSGNTCQITGTPTAITSEASYTITGSNAISSDTATVSISIIAGAAVGIEAAVVERHNYYRSLDFQDSPLTWDTTLADHAQQWAEYIAANYTNADRAAGSPHASEFHVNTHGLPYAGEGENIAWASNTLKYVRDEAVDITVEDSSLANYEFAAVDMWANEKAYYDYTTNSGGGNVVGHYTQVVWQKTRKVGCGKAVSTTDMLGEHIVCRYSVAGNMLGEKPYCSNYTVSDLYTNDSLVFTNAIIENGAFNLTKVLENRSECTRTESERGSLVFSGTSSAILSDFVFFDSNGFAPTANFDVVNIDADGVLTLTESAGNKRMILKLIGETSTYYSAEAEWTYDVTVAGYTRRAIVKLAK